MDLSKRIFTPENPRRKTRSELVALFGTPHEVGNYPPDDRGPSRRAYEARPLPPNERGVTNGTITGTGENTSGAPIEGRLQFMTWRPQGEEVQVIIATGDAFADAWIAMPIPATIKGDGDR